MKQKILSSVLLGMIFFGLNAVAAEPVSKAATSEKQSQLTPQKALMLLKEGNQRFIDNKMRTYDFAKEMKVTSKKGQFPLAVILSCIDSRSIPDFLFDQGLGNLFVSRVAGNVTDTDLMGSMEFATKLAGARLVIVMGHTQCGAVQGACLTNADTGLKNLDKLLNKILPAVSTLKSEHKDLNCKTNEAVDQIARQNVLNQLKVIYEQSDVIKQQVDNKSIYLLGAMHDIRTGKVQFFDKEGNKL